MRTLSGFWKHIVSVLSIALVAFHMYTCAFGILPDTLQRSVHLGFVLTLCFLMKTPFKKSPKDKLPWYDVVMAALAVGSTIYTFHIYDEVLWDPMQWIGPLDIFFAVATVLLILEAGRRTVGAIFIVLTGAFLIYSYFGPYFPGIWGHETFGFDFIFQTFYHSTNGIWGTMTGISATMLALFGIFSAVLSETGGAATFVRIGQNAVGNMVGGQGKVALVASGLFGMISGSAMANVMATGTFTIPLMRKAGYSKEWAAATSAVGSTGGQIMPPIMGAGAFIMAQLLGMSYLDIAVAAILPAFLYYLSGFMSIHFISRRDNIRGGNVDAARVTLLEYMIIVVPLVVFLYYLFRRYTVDTAALWASIAGFIFFALTHAWRIRGQGPVAVTRAIGALANKICIESAGAILAMASLLASAQLVIALIQLTGFGVKMSDLIVSIGQNYLFLCLVLSMIVCAILGMGLPTTAAYILAAAVLVPPLLALDLNPLVAHLFVFYYATLATITPPVCAAVFLSSGIAEANWLKTGFLSCMIALPVFIVPYVFAYNSILLFQFAGHEAFEIGLAFVTAILGVVSIAMGVAGFNKRTLNPFLRLIAIVAGVLMVVPEVMPSIAGMVIFAAIYFATRTPVATAPSEPAEEAPAA